MDYRKVDAASNPHYNAGLKLAWANKHLRAFDAEVGRFLQGKTHSIWTEDDLEADEYVLHLDPEPLGVELGLIAGDALCCMRASLDHLACALTLTPQGIRNDKASFPIIPVRNSSGRKLFSSSLNGVPAAAIKIIDDLQPYHHGDAYTKSQLWKLHRLWNIDKHRRIPLYAAGVQVPVSFPNDMPPIARETDDGGVLRFPLTAKPHVNFVPPVKFNIYLGDESEGIILSAKELVQIYDFLRSNVFPRFVCFFEGSTR